MKTFFEYCAAYLKRISLMDFLILKVCLCSFAALIGMTITPKHRDTMFLLLTMTFGVSYALLMKGFFQFFSAHRLHAME
ncbi:MAG TPA: hypothetical protein VFF80_05855 [Bacillota bacterium]|nr:hypothetical protein [Bacillota bacterium]